jgi:hypothetical protein
MTDYTYRPLLKAKQGEFGALGTLDDGVREALTPIMEALPDHADDAEKFVKPMVKVWPVAVPFLLDYRLAEAKAAAALSRAADRLADEGRIVVPVVAISRPEEYTRTAAAVARRHKAGAAIRLSADDIGDVDELPGVLDSLLSRLRLDSSETDVLIDLYAFTPAHVGAMTTASVAAIRSLPRLAEWRSVTVMGTSFPETLSAVKPDTVAKLPRAEWRVWDRIRTRTLPRQPDFGDYGVNHPELPDVDPRYMTMSANLRYTVEDNWLVFKGRDVKKHGYEQFNSFCKKLVQMPEYAGEEFSWGDAAIRARCKGRSGPGNASTWRQIGTSHHLTFVVRELANPDGS